MGIVSPHMALAGMMASTIPRTRYETISIVPQGQDSTGMVERETDPVVAARTEVDAISSIGTESGPANSKDLNTTPIVWMCIVIFAVIILIIACVSGNRRQNKRDQLAGMTKNDEERKFPPAQRRGL